VWCALGVPPGSQEAGPLETFWIRRKLGDESTVQLRSVSGHWLRTGSNATLLSDIE